MDVGKANRNSYKYSQVGGGSTQKMAEIKPRILVLGGLGSIGRNFVKHCVDEDLCSYIRVADKTMPMIAMLSPAHAAAFDSTIVEFCQADLNREAHIDKAFKDGSFQYVFNLAADTKFGRPTKSYETTNRDLPANTAARARKDRAKFIQVSSGQVYKCSSKTPSAEDGDIAPFTTPATYQLGAEKKLQSMAAEADGLDLVILRPATVYGPGDQAGLMPRCVCAVSDSLFGSIFLKLCF